jgi:hypothetical protein
MGHVFRGVKKGSDPRRLTGEHSVKAPLGTTAGGRESDKGGNPIVSPLFQSANGDARYR